MKNKRAILLSKLMEAKKLDAVILTTLNDTDFNDNIYLNVLKSSDDFKYIFKVTITIEYNSPTIDYFFLINSNIIKQETKKYKDGLQTLSELNTSIQYKDFS
jgi:hypothetical protein